MYIRHELINYSIKTPKLNVVIKIYLSRDFAAGVYQSETPSSPRFMFGVV